MQDVQAAQIWRGTDSPADLSLDEFVQYARELESPSCQRCGLAEAPNGNEFCQPCLNPTTLERLGLARVWRRISEKLGI